VHKDGKGQDVLSLIILTIVNINALRQRWLPSWPAAHDITSHTRTLAAQEPMPQKLPGAKNGTPPRNMLPPSFEGTVVTHVPPVNVVVAVVADGENVICASGTLMVYGVPLAVNWIAEPSTLIVNGLDPDPLAFSTLLNQM